MYKWVTKIFAINNTTGKMEEFIPDLYIEAETFEEAQKWCKENAGYLHVIGKLDSEVSEKKNKTSIKYLTK